MFAVEIEFLRQVYVASDASDEPETVVHPTRVFAGLVQACHANDMLRHRPALERLEEAPAPEIYMGKTLKTTENTTTYYVPTHAKKANANAKPNDKSEPWGMSKDVLLRPTTRLAEPRCLLVWPSLNLTAEDQEALDELLGEVMYVGRTESLVSLRRVETPNYTNLDRKFVPDSKHGNVPIRVPRPGVLEALEDAFDNGEHLDHWPAITYRQHKPLDGIPSIWSSMLRIKLINPKVPVHATRALRLVEAVRSKLASFQQDGRDVPAIVTGHGWKGGPSHVAVVPLVFTEHTRASGMVKGLGICIPSNISDGDRLELMTLLNFLCEEGVFLKGQHYELKLVERNKPTLLTLRHRQWCAPSRVWTTVTPVVLDVPPKKNRSVPLLVARACEHIGLPAPSKVEWGKIGFHGATIPSTEQFEVSHKGSVPISGQVVHLRLTFEDPVRGPVSLGRLRHYGIGLMRPEVGHA